MSKQAKTILIGWIGMIPLAVMIILVLLQNLGVLEAHAAPVEDFTVEETEAVNEAELSAMPCIDTESFRRFLETYEPETGEKEIQETIWSDAGETGGGDLQSAQPGANRTIYGCGVEDGRSIDGGDRGNDRDPEGARIYLIAGKLIDPEIQRKLYRALEAEGIGYWYTGALAQMWQESQGQQYRINETNLEDMGLFQYKNRYWDWSEGDIFDADVQIRKYAREMAARFNSGLSVDEAISRHMTSDFVSTINREYVRDVKQWLSQMEAVE